jgi:ATP-binding cassette subfamily B protein
MNVRTKKFLSYYKPHMRVFISVMICALIAAGITLSLPLCVRYITKTVLEGNMPNALEQIYRVGALMVALLAIQAACGFVVDYWGHAMGAMMESDLRRELFAHYQKLSFRFYDEHKTGQLMSRITNDLLSLAELYHHAPEDILIYSVKFIGAFVILLSIDVELTLVAFLFLPVTAAYSIFFNRRMHQALRSNKERIGDINVQVEDSLAGIRVVKSFTNEGIEQEKFAYENNRFLESRKNTYKNPAHHSSCGRLWRRKHRELGFRPGGLDHVPALCRVSDRAHPEVLARGDAVPGRGHRV